MISSVSISSFIAVGLTMPSPENKLKPAYTSKDLVQLYQMKSNDINTFYRYSPNTTLAVTLWVLFWTIVSYYFGVLHFDHDNLDKAHEVVRHIINAKIKLLEKFEGRLDRGDQDNESNSSYFEDIRKLKHKWAKEEILNKKIKDFKKNIDKKEKEKEKKENDKLLKELKKSNPDKKPDENMEIE
jgi:hypothetical protein